MSFMVMFRLHMCELLNVCGITDIIASRNKVSLRNQSAHCHVLFILGCDVTNCMYHGAKLLHHKLV